MARAGADIRWHDRQLHDTLTGPSGDVARELMRRAIRVQNQAKINASGRPGPMVDTGRLRGSIATEGPTIDGGECAVYIGTNVPYGAYLEHGTSRMPAYPWLLPSLSAF